MSKFQLALLIAFGFFLVVAVLVFAFYRGGGGGSRVSEVVVWGDISAYDVNVLFNETQISQNEDFDISYVEKSPETLYTEYTEALARGIGPDLIIISQDQIWKEREKLISIPYDNLSERDFRESFIEEGELFLTSQGVLAIPLSVDPMVLYYNRNLLTSAGQVRPIAFWDELYAASSALTKRDLAGNITSSTIALGEAVNINNFKDILSLLLIQAGTPISSLNGESLRPELNSTFNLPIAPGESALDFYTQFSNPNRTYYSWNRSMTDAQTHFTAGNSAYYLGFASELRVLRSKNPTLNLGVALVPQSRVSGRSVTYGKLRAVAISRGTASPGAALAVATLLTSRDVSLELSSILLVPSPRRDVLELKPTDAIFSVFYDAALQSRAWLDPEPNASKTIFREMVESVTSGRARINEALSRANRELETLMR